MQTVTGETRNETAPGAGEIQDALDRVHRDAALGAVNRILYVSGWEPLEQYPAVLDKLLGNGRLFKLVAAVAKLLFKLSQPVFKLSNLVAKAEHFLLARLAAIELKREALAKKGADRNFSQQVKQV